MARLGWPSLLATVIMVTSHIASEDVMTNQWHVHLVDDLGKDVAMNVAKRNGFSYVSPVRSVVSSTSLSNPCYLSKK